MCSYKHAKKVQFSGWVTLVAGILILLLSCTSKQTRRTTLYSCKTITTDNDTIDCEMPLFSQYDVDFEAMYLKDNGGYKKLLAYKNGELYQVIELSK